MGKRHHFVPRFYLRAFAIDARRINLYNLKRDHVVLGASLRDQCYVHRLYGREYVENAFSELEDSDAALFKSMRDRLVVPGGGTPERDSLMSFLGLQLARTTAAQNHAVKMSKLLTTVAFNGAAPDGFAMNPDEAIRTMLGVAPRLATTIQDLSLTLVCSPSETPFVTSDNPAFKYNTYCEGITHSGVTGTQSRGLQLFLPLSPKVLLYAFDAAVYKLVRTGKRGADATATDVSRLNRLQFIGASENVYFVKEPLGEKLQRTATATAPIREAAKPRLVRAVDDADKNSELLHQFWPMPQLGLNLSFVQVRPKAEETPLLSRARQVRAPFERPRRREDSHGTSRRYSVHSHHELSE